MAGFTFTKTGIEGLYLISPLCVTDVRGAFVKDYSAETFTQNGLTHELKEVFYTYSHKGVVRAIHFQRVKQQGKLVRCVHGQVFDVVVDLRKDSPTFKKWLSFDLSGENGNELLIPEGCGHGYIVLQDSIVSYKCNEDFYGEYDDGIMWNDPDLGIEWPTHLVPKIILSDKDKELQSFEKFMNTYGGF